MVAKGDGDVGYGLPNSWGEARRLPALLQELGLLDVAADAEVAMFPGPAGIGVRAQRPHPAASPGLAPSP